MLRDRSIFSLCVCVMLVLWFAVPFLVGASEPHGSRKKGRTVWVVFFSSRDCPRCESVKELLKALQSTYPVRTRVFDLEREKDYALFRRLESIHSDREFGVPLVMVGESIIQGEDQIADKLEKAVKRLSRTGGASLPYLGGPDEASHVVSHPSPEHCPSCNKGRPPTLQEEMGRIKVIFDKLF